MKKMIVAGIAIVLLTVVLILLLFKMPQALPSNTFLIYSLCLSSLLAEFTGGNALVDFIKSKYFQKDLVNNGEQKKEAGG